MASSRGPAGAGAPCILDTPMSSSVCCLILPYHVFWCMLLCTKTHLRHTYSSGTLDPPNHPHPLSDQCAAKTSAHDSLQPGEYDTETLGPT